MNRTTNDSNFNLGHFKDASALGIIRGASLNSVPDLMDACFSGGLQFIEFTLNSEESLLCIEAALKLFSSELCVGAGTVVSVSDATRAINAGAQFIVSPTLNEDVASYCNEKGLAYFPGALTPTEIERSWDSGATMVKVFPASQMGPEYLSTVQGPFKDILLLAVGGIKASNADEYLRAGASAVAIGGSVFSPSRIKNKEFDAIKIDVSKFVLAVKLYYSRINKISN